MASDKTTPLSPKVTGLLFWQKYWRESLVLCFFAIGLYAYSIQFEYVLDDKIVISENSFVKKGYGGIKEILTTESFSGYFGEQKDLVVGARYRPLSIVSFAIEYAHFGLNPKISHALNILLYTLCGLLIFRLFTLLLQKNNYTSQWFLAIPFLTALIFIVHPIHSEVVANVKGRDEIMTLLFSLLALYCFIKATLGNKLMWYIIGVFSFFLALLSKENALTFIAIIPLSIYFFTKQKLKDLIIPSALLVATGLAYLYLRYSVIGYFLSSGKEITDIMNNPFYGLESSEKFATIFYTLGQYLKLLVFPHPLTHDYYPYHVPIMTWGDWQSILGFGINTGLGLWAIWRLKKGDLLAYGILFYFISLSIVSNIPFTVGTFMNERFLFVSSVGFCLILAWFINYMIPKLLSELPGQASILNSSLLILFILGFSYKTIDRVPAWKDTFSLNSAAIKVSKNSARANLFMGTALYNRQLNEADKKLKAEMVEQAAYYIQRAIDLNPKYGSALNMRGGIAAEQYKIDKDLDKLLNTFYELLTVRPNYQFITEYIEYLLPRADNEKLAQFLVRVSQYWSKKGQFKVATLYLEKYALQAKPNDPQIRQILAYLYEKMGNETKAAQYR